MDRSWVDVVAVVGPSLVAAAVVVAPLVPRILPAIPRPAPAVGAVPVAAILVLLVVPSHEG